MDPTREPRLSQIKELRDLKRKVVKEKRRLTSPKCSKCGNEDLEVKPMRGQARYTCKLCGHLWFRQMPTRPRRAGRLPSRVEMARKVIE
jgi:transposase-like protein